MYIDPGAGSIIFQAIIGAFVSVAVLVGLFWSRIKIFIRGKFSK